MHGIYALSVGHWVLAYVTSIMVGIAKTGLPALSILIAPLFAEVMPARASTGALLPLLIAADAFAVIFWRGIRATLRINDDFGRYLALGLTVVVVVQGFMHMSVVLGMMPTKGIPLPMISYGGSSLVSTLASLGMLMNVSEHAG